MRPTFRSARALLAFSALLVVLCALPVLMSWLKVPSVESIYKDGPNGVGPFPFYHQQIFKETSDIDVLFLGPSTLWSAIDPIVVEKELTKFLGRKAVVLTLGNNWRSEDFTHFQLKNLLERRKVRMLVVNLAYDEQGGPHALSQRWHQFDRDVYDGLSARNQAILYAQTLVGSVRQLSSLVRTLPQAVPADIAQNLGALKISKSVDVAFQRTSVEPNMRSYTSEELSSGYEFSDPYFADYQKHFLSKWFELTRKHGVKVVNLYMPKLADAQAEKVSKVVEWKKHFGLDIENLGLPGKQIFGNLSQDEIKNHYYDDAHLNINGCERFTKMVTPTIVKVYADYAQAH